MNLCSRKRAGDFTWTMPWMLLRAKGKGFAPAAEKVDVVEIEDSPRKSPEKVFPPHDGDGLVQTPEPKEVDSKESPQSTEKARDAFARRSLRFPKLWWDAHGNVRIGKKLSYAPKFVKMLPSTRNIDNNFGWPQEPFYIGGRYFSRAIRYESEDEAMSDDGYGGNDTNVMEGAMLEAMEVDADEGADSENGTPKAAPTAPEEQTQLVLADGYETLEVEEEVEVGVMEKKWCFFKGLLDKSRSFWDYLFVVFFQEKIEDPVARASQQKGLRDKGGKKQKVKKNKSKNKDKEDKDLNQNEKKKKEKKEDMQLVPKAQQPRYRALLARIFDLHTVFFNKIFPDQPTTFFASSQAGGAVCQV